MCCLYCLTKIKFLFVYNIGGNVMNFYIGKKIEGINQLQVGADKAVEAVRKFTGAANEFRVKPFALLSTYELQRQTLSREIVSDKRDLSILEQESRGLKARFRELTQNVNVLREELLQLTDDIKSLALEFGADNDEVQRLLFKEADMRMEIGKQERQLDEVAAQLDDCQSQIDEKTSDLKEKVEERNKVEICIDELKEGLTDPQTRSRNFVAGLVRDAEYRQQGKDGNDDLIAGGFIGERLEQLKQLEKNETDRTYGRGRSDIDREM
jgi:chromosome segregation ATPase